MTGISNTALTPRPRTAMIAPNNHPSRRFTPMRLAQLAGLSLLLLSACASNTVLAEATSLRAAKQYGLGYVQYMIMEDMKLVEKHATTAGLGDIEVTWNTFRSSDVMNDALISGN